MELRKTALERAFELARSGKCLNLSDIGKHLKSERYDPIYNEGRALKLQLLKLIDDAKGKQPRPATRLKRSKAIGIVPHSRNLMRPKTLTLNVIVKV